MHVIGDEVWNHFEREAGKHCVQRIGTTETNGRRHTSFVSVAVLELPSGNSERLVPVAELDITFQKGHGKGGQHQNTTDSACRIKHKATGLMVFINGRDQHTNRRNAIRIISAKINQIELDKQKAEYNKGRKILAKGGRGETEKIRTYNFLKGFVVDHRTGRKTGNVKAIMKGQLELLV